MLKIEYDIENEDNDIENEDNIQEKSFVCPKLIFIKDSFLDDEKNELSEIKEFRPKDRIFYNFIFYLIQILTNISDEDNSSDKFKDEILKFLYKNLDYMSKIQLNTANIYFLNINTNFNCVYKDLITNLTELTIKKFDLLLSSISNDIQYIYYVFSKKYKNNNSDDQNIKLMDLVKKNVYFYKEEDDSIYNILTSLKVFEEQLKKRGEKTNYSNENSFGSDKYLNLKLQTMFLTKFINKEKNKNDNSCNKSV